MTSIDIDTIAEKAALGALDDLISDGCGLAELIDTYGDPAAVGQLADSDWQKLSDELAGQLRVIRAALAANATEYTFGDPEDPYCTVQYRGAGKWAVARGRYNLDRATGEWHFELRPSVRGEEWLAAHRFDLGEALRLAEQVTADRGSKPGAQA